jgi:hypothetical protein
LLSQVLPERGKLAKATLLRRMSFLRNTSRFLDHLFKLGMACSRVSSDAIGQL